MTLHLLLAVGSVLVLWLGSVCMYLSLLYAYGDSQGAVRLSERC